MKPKRLIQNDDIILDGTGPRYEKEAQAFHKLWEHEEIEAELGIDLVTLFKALKNGIYTTIYKTYVFGNELTIETRSQGFSFKEYECDIVAYFKDYGKTWALTREELE